MRVWARVSGSVLGVSSAIAVLAKASRLRWPSGVRFEVIVLRILASAGFMSVSCSSFNASCSTRSIRDLSSSARSLANASARKAFSVSSLRSNVGMLRPAYL